MMATVLSLLIEVVLFEVSTVIAFGNKVLPFLITLFTAGRNRI